MSHWKLGHFNTISILRKVNKYFKSAESPTPLQGVNAGVGLKEVTSSEQNAFFFLSSSTDFEMGWFGSITVCGGSQEQFLPSQRAKMCLDRLGDAGHSSWDPTF